GGGAEGGMLASLEGLRPTPTQRVYRRLQLQDLQDQTACAAQAWATALNANGIPLADECGSSSSKAWQNESTGQSANLPAKRTDMVRHRSLSFNPPPSLYTDRFTTRKLTSVVIMQSSHGAKSSPAAAQRADCGDVKRFENTDSHSFKRPRILETAPAPAEPSQMQQDEADIENLLGLDDILDLVELANKPETETASTVEDLQKFETHSHVNQADPAPLASEPQADEMTLEASDSEDEFVAVKDLFTDSLPHTATGKATSRGYAPRAPTYAPVPQGRRSIFDSYKHHPIAINVKTPNGVQAEEDSVDCNASRFAAESSDCSAALADDPSGGLHEGGMDSPYETPCTANISQGMNIGVRHLLEQLSLSPEDGMLSSRVKASRHYSCVCDENAAQHTLAQRRHSELSYATRRIDCASHRLSEAEMVAHATARSSAKLERLPMPAPSLLVGLDGDALPVSPGALFWWEKAALQPIAFRKQLSYAVLCPEETSESSVSAFCQELGVLFRACRLGSLSPLEGGWLHRFTVADPAARHEGLQVRGETVFMNRPSFMSLWKPSLTLKSCS
ncbi:MAG: hypothetical protein SGPRY_009405, partial [Prymnesium sp.]